MHIHTYVHIHISKLTLSIRGVLFAVFAFVISSIFSLTTSKRSISQRMNLKNIKKGNQLSISGYKCIYTYIFTRIYIYMNIHICMHVYNYIQAIQIPTDESEYVINIFISIYVWIYIIHMHMDVHIYTYISLTTSKRSMFHRMFNIKIYD
jgi:hypothetical protein